MKKKTQILKEREREKNESRNIYVVVTNINWLIKLGDVMLIRHKISNWLSSHRWFCIKDSVGL